MKTNINIKVDKEVKEKAEEIFNELGLDIDAAINMFLKRTIYENGIPFEFESEIPNDITIKAFEEGDRLLNDPNAKGYHSIEELKEALK